MLQLHAADLMGIRPVMAGAREKGSCQLTVAQIDGAEKFGPVISRIGGRGREEDIAVLLARFGEVLAAGC